MRVLALDTSSPNGGSWAVCEGGSVLIEKQFEGRASSALAESLAEQKEAWHEVEQILVGVGPGSFSGVRVAIALAQGLALPCQRTITPVRSSHAVALQYQQVSFLGVFCPARTREWLVQYYECGMPSRPLQCIAESDLEEHLSKCSLAVNVGEPHPSFAHQACPQASLLARWNLTHGAEPNLPLEPVYLTTTNG